MIFGTVKLLTFCKHSHDPMWRMHPDPLRIDEQWKTGVMPDIRSKLTF